MQYELGEVSAQGEARRRSTVWARTQDALAEEAAGFLRRKVPRGQQIVSEKERTGTVWIVKRGIAPANLSTGAEFLRRFGARAGFRVIADADEYRLGLASPPEAWRVGRGRAFCVLYLFLAITLLGALLMFRPEILFEAFPLV